MIKVTHANLYIEDAMSANLMHDKAQIQRLVKCLTIDRHLPA